MTCWERLRDWYQAGVDIYRVEDGRIAEHWDVLQEEVSPTVSGHPMFTVPGRAEHGLCATGQSRVSC
jgi:hypothetical protein